jgi:outer membrane protein assembly factor BamB
LHLLFDVVSVDKGGCKRKRENLKICGYDFSFLPFFMRRFDTFAPLNTPAPEKKSRSTGRIFLWVLSLLASVGAGFGAGWFGHTHRAQQIERQRWELARRPWPAQQRAARPIIAPTDPPLELAPAPTPPSQWRLDREHTGRSGYVLPHEPSIYREIRTQDRVTAQPVLLRLRGGRAPNTQTATELLIVGSHDGALYGVDALDATIRWRTLTGDRVYSTALVTATPTLYVGTDNDRFFSVEPQSNRGSVQWALATDDDADTSAGQADDGTIRFSAGRVLYAVRPDLTVLWRLALPSKLYSSPVVLADGTTLLGCQDDKIYCITPQGTVRWSFATGADVDATPAVMADSVYVGSDDGYLYALQISTGHLQWKTRLGGFVRAGVALGLDQSLVVGTFGPSPRVVSLDRDTGRQRWSVAVEGGPPTAEWGVLSSALIDREGRIAVGTPLGQLWLIERDGRVTAKVNLGSAIDSSPVLIRDGVIAVGSDGGTVFLLADIPRPPEISGH